MCLDSAHFPGSAVDPSCYKPALAADWMGLRRQVHWHGILLQMHVRHGGRRDEGSWSPELSAPASWSSWSLADDSLVEAGERVQGGRQCLSCCVITSLAWILLNATCSSSTERARVRTAQKSKMLQSLPFTDCNVPLGCLASLWMCVLM